MPAIKGDMYINTHCNYSQPASIKLYNENIGGHLTPLQPESRFLPIPHLHSTPRLGGSCGNIAIPFGTEKLEWCGYPMVT